MWEEEVSNGYIIDVYDVYIVPIDFNVKDLFFYSFICSDV